MKSHTKYLTFNVPARMDFVNITGEVEQAVRDSGVQEGLCLVNAMHSQDPLRRNRQAARWLWLRLPCR